MDKLDENYLDLIRDSLYKKHRKGATKHSVVSSKKLKNEVCDYEGSPKNTIKKGFKTKKETFKAKLKVQCNTKKKIKRKQVKFIDDTNSEIQKSSNPLVSNEIKNRVTTPFKKSDPLRKLGAKKSPKPNLNELNDCAIVSAPVKKVSPSLNENDVPLFHPLSGQNKSPNLNESGKNKNNNNVKSNKRLLSSSDSPELSRKRKKGKPFVKQGKKLMFDDSLGESEINRVINGSDTDHCSRGDSKKKKGNNRHTEKGLDTKFSLETCWPSETDSSLSSTWGNFIYSLKDDKNNENTEKPKKKKLLSINEKTDSNKEEGNISSVTELSNLHTIADIQTKSRQPLIASSTTVDKKSDNKNRNPSHKIKKLKVKKKDLIMTKSKISVKKVLQSDSSDNFSDSDIEFNPKVSSSSSSEDCKILSDKSDDETVGVKGLKFQTFCNLFPPVHNEQFVGQTNALHIPKKYFKVSENDLETDWQCEESPSQKRKERHTKPATRPASKGKNNISLESEFGDCEEAPIQQKINHSDSLNKKKGTKKKINVLEVQIFNKLTDSNGSNDQETQEETSDVLTEAGKLNQDYSQENETHPKPSSKPMVLTLKNGNKIVALNLDDIIHFHGLCQITVLNGELEILGASINVSSGTKKLYSPRGTALLYIKNKKVLFVDDSVKLKNLVSDEMLHSKDVELTFELHYAIFLCKELQEPYMDFIERYISQKIFPESSTQELRLDFKLHGSWNRLRTDDTWEEVLENFPKDSKVVISGGKGVGKSTFLRFAVNFLLGRFDKIRVVDLDPGQSEFFSPGCISIVTVDKHVFGPNYTHLLEPDSSILSNINMGYDIKKYIASVRYLLESLHSMEPLPTIINFPGFTQGIGLDISAATLKLVEPSLVIQMESKTQSKNYKMDLTADNVKKVLEENVILNKNQVNNTVNLCYDFEKLESLAENNETWTLEARQGREMNILSYFGKLMSESICDLTDAAVTMYSISLSALAITNSEGRAISPLAVNSNLVALCSKLDDSSAIFSCHGYGFVRGIDLQTDTLVLITPEPTETLEKVSHLILGSVTTPPSLIMTANGITGHIPYVNVGEPVDFGQFTRRSYLPPRK